MAPRAPAHPPPFAQSVRLSRTLGRALRCSWASPDFAGPGPQPAVCLLTAQPSLEPGLASFLAEDPEGDRANGTWWGLGGCQQPWSHGWLLPQIPRTRTRGAGGHGQEWALGASAPEGTSSDGLRGGHYKIQIPHGVQNDLSESLACTFFVFNFSYSCLERGEGKEKETLMCGCLSCTPYWGPGWKPRHRP